MTEMLADNRKFRAELTSLPREQLRELQARKLSEIWDRSISKNRFYQHKLGNYAKKPKSPADLAEIPFTTKDELLGDMPSSISKNLTFDIAEYTRLHRTSGTKGKPMAVLDTPADWQWWIDTWQFVLDAADVDRTDRAVMAFSFGPFIGFWSAYDAAIHRGMLVAPTGGLSTEARLDLIKSIDATCVFCTPSYALRMVEVARENKIAIENTSVKSIIVAGEPGGCIPGIRGQIETSWNAKVVDHSGASEIGPWGFDAGEGLGLFVNESEFIAEFFSLDSHKPASEGELSELVLTSLGRFGCPVVRYRTGDLVRPRWDHEHRTNFVLLEGGVLGRVDDMMIVRGVNIYPSSIEAILREFSEVLEYQLTVFKSGSMDELTIKVECPEQLVNTISQELYKRLGLRVDVQYAMPQTLPRFDAKGKRFIDRRDR